MRVFMLISGYLGFLALCFGWGFSHFGERYWLADLLSNFVIQFIIAYSVLSIFFLLFLRIKMALLTGGIAVYIAAVGVYPLYDNTGMLQDCSLCQTEEITVVQYNLKYDNPQINYVISWMLEDSGADVIMLQEADDRWKEKLFMLSIGFPYNLGDKEGFPDGMAIYSKIPITAASFRKGSLGRSTYSRVEIQTPQLQIPIVLYDVHPVSPMKLSHWYMRNFHLLDIANEISKERIKNRIVVGDFNTTQWSYWYKKMEQISGLKNAQNGFGFNISWSPFKSKPFFAGLYIDHMLVSDGIKIMSRAFAPDLGSDHLPVVTTITVNKNMMEEYSQATNQ